MAKIPDININVRVLVGDHSDLANRIRYYLKVERIDSWGHGLMSEVLEVLDPNPSKGVDTL